jgi:hypothetical protein
VGVSKARDGPTEHMQGKGEGEGGQLAGPEAHQFIRKYGAAGTSGGYSSGNADTAVLVRHPTDDVAALMRDGHTERFVVSLHVGQSDGG